MLPSKYKVFSTTAIVKALIFILTSTLTIQYMASSRCFPTLSTEDVISIGKITIVFKEIFRSISINERYYLIYPFLAAPIIAITAFLLILLLKSGHVTRSRQDKTSKFIRSLPFGPVAPVLMFVAVSYSWITNNRAFDLVFGYPLNYTPFEVFAINIVYSLMLFSTLVLSFWRSAINDMSSS